MTDKRERQRKAEAAYRERNKEVLREKARVRQKAFADKNPDIIKQRNKAFYQKLKQDPEKLQAHHKRSFAKLLEKMETIAEYPRPNECEICLSSDRKIAFDHCHTKNTFRGWICNRCNTALGLVYDSIDTLERMITYLKMDDGRNDHKIIPGQLINRTKASKKRYTKDIINVETNIES